MMNQKALSFKLLIGILLVLTTGFVVKAQNSPSTGEDLPEGLITLEAIAEDIFDYAPAGNWTRITDDLNEIIPAWREYAPQAAVDGVARSSRYALNTALAVLQAAVTAQDVAATMQAVNDFSGAVVDMFATYNPTVPVDIGRLDVLGRQVILDVQAGNFEAAALTLAETATIWNRVKPLVLEKGGEGAAAEFDTSLQSQNEALAASDAEALSSEAANGLEIVDTLEGVF